MELLQSLQPVLTITGFFFVLILCLAGIILSCLSISGTWLVLAATILTSFLRNHQFPGLWTIGTFLILSILVEVAEFAAAWFGVTKRGGSSLAGFMAVVGGIAGLFIGGLIPIPVIGNLIGMLAGSFTLAFIVEKRRLRKTNQAMDIAMGAVIARIFTVILKVCVTLGMITFLLIGMIFGN